jgi:pSer/pThr/pTyr-binding forkhead associated (FHA) protein
MTAEPILLLRVADGELVGTRFRVTGPSVVGRSPDCTVSIADPSLSRRHFELVRSDDMWRVTDLASRNGLSVNGTPVRHAIVGPGDEIRAGAVTFRLEIATSRLSEVTGEDRAESAVDAAAAAAPIQLFRAVAPTLSAAAPAPADETMLARLLGSIRREARWKLYAIVDGAQAFELAFAARLMGHELYTLFSGELAESAAHVGPCLVAIGEPSALLQQWVEKMGSNAGVLFESTAEVDRLCAHLRTIFVATDEEGQEYFFRFYDPRVLRAFLPTCRLDELREFFGPIDSWIAETRDGSAFTVSSLTESGLSERSITAAAR